MRPNPIAAECRIVDTGTVIYIVNGRGGIVKVITPDRRRGDGYGCLTKPGKQSVK